MESKKYHRIVLKLSGEALAGKQGYGIDPETVETIAKQVVEVNKLGVQVAIVVGGGNIWRGLSGSAKGMDRVSADYMGMLATVMNSLALQDAMEKNGVATRVQTAINMQQVAEPYILTSRRIRQPHCGLLKSKPMPSSWPRTASTASMTAIPNSIRMPRCSSI